MKPEDCKRGMAVRVNGTPLHNGHIVTIVDARSELVRARAKAQQTGAKLSEGPTHRPGLVPAFDPAYPTTLWWWFAPHQLQEVAK